MTTVGPSDIWVVLTPSHTQEKDLMELTIQGSTTSGDIVVTVEGQSAHFTLKPGQAKRLTEQLGELKLSGKGSEVEGDFRFILSFLPAKKTSTPWAIRNYELGRKNKHKKPAYLQE